jgi:hypothetical protein
VFSESFGHQFDSFVAGGGLGRGCLCATRTALRTEIQALATSTRKRVVDRAEGLRLLILSTYRRAWSAPVVSGQAARALILTRLWARTPCPTQIRALSVVSIRGPAAACGNQPKCNQID